MVNPFDHTFFKFFIGFIVILTASFGLLYLVNSFEATSEAQTAIIAK